MDRTDDREARHSRDVADDVRPLDVPLRQRLLPMLEVLARIGAPHGPRAASTAQDAALVRGSERTRQPAKGVMVFASWDHLMHCMLQGLELQAQVDTS